MKSYALKLGVLALTFVIGVFVNTQVLHLAYTWIPDVDPQPKIDRTFSGHRRDAEDAEVAQGVEPYVSEKSVA